MPAYRVLFCSSEVYPLIKTGGLADVSGSLPHALSKLGHDVHIIMPAYQAALVNLKHAPKTILKTSILNYPVTLQQTTLPGSRVPVWLVDCPELFDRPGNPYLDETGKPWKDNASRFMVFNRMICSIALNRCGLNWQPDLVHCNDWQTGLVPALLEEEPQRPATVFTIHNLAYQGIFDRATFEDLQLSEYFWHYERLEYHDHFSFIKGGLVYADRISTVSPNYAREIQTAEFGHGLHDLLLHRNNRLSGIINGIDTRVWNPGTDTHIESKYNRNNLEDKLKNKHALQKKYSLPVVDDVLLLGLVSRLAEQKGIDMLLSIIPALIKRPIQLVILGSGDRQYEKKLKQVATRFPDKVAVHTGYDETLAHLIEAGADVFLMPSRFEPCGLNQMYSQRYGTLPIVSPVGGLYDTVVNVDKNSQQDRTATGFIMETSSATALLETIDRALGYFEDKTAWNSLMKTAMKQDFSWEKSAAQYAQLYQQAVRDNHKAINN
ncbi:MAG: glycogen synthase GlgA [Thioalkalispiraceae bacterium]|jgi:starch synthase